MTCFRHRLMSLASGFAIVALAGCSSSSGRGATPACETISDLCRAQNDPIALECLQTSTAEEQSVCLEATPRCASHCGPSIAEIDSGSAVDAGRFDADPAADPDASVEESGEPPMVERHPLEVGMGSGADFRPWADGERVAFEVGGQGAAMIEPTVVVRADLFSGMPFESERAYPVFQFITEGRPDPYNLFAGLDTVSPDSEVSWTLREDGGYEAVEIRVPFGYPNPDAPPEVTYTFRTRVTWFVEREDDFDAYVLDRVINLVVTPPDE